MPYGQENTGNSISIKSMYSYVVTLIYNLKQLVLSGIKCIIETKERLNKSMFLIL